MPKRTFRAAAPVAVTIAFAAFAPAAVAHDTTGTSGDQQGTQTQQQTSRHADNGRHCGWSRTGNRHRVTHDSPRQGVGCPGAKPRSSQGATTTTGSSTAGDDTPTKSGATTSSTCASQTREDDDTATASDEKTTSPSGTCSREDGEDD